MIGLGSNRLTVCRRGGMSVTQAGKGGMEWLAGGRGPSWASPYSAQATAALKAQFPTQWPTIRDYGFAHPEIVGYMNAYAPEDAKIAYSLVPTLGVRKITTSASGSYFVAGNIFELTDTIECIAKRTTTGSGYVGVFGFRENQVGFGIMHTGSLEWTIAGSNGRQAEDWDDLDKLYKYTMTNGKLIAENMATHAEVTLTYNALSSLSLTKGFGIFCFMQEGSPTNYGQMTGDVESLAIIKSDNTDRHRFVPFIRNGQAELLDIVTGQLAERHGSFTISETPANQTP